MTKPTKHILLLAFAACGGSGLSSAVRDDITARMTSAQTPIAACYGDALKGNHKLHGTLVVQFAAAPSTGQFGEVSVASDQLNDPKLRDCVIAEVGKLKLDKPQSTKVAASYPIHFEWTK